VSFLVLGLAELLMGWETGYISAPYYCEIRSPVKSRLALNGCPSG